MGATGAHLMNCYNLDMLIGSSSSSPLELTDGDCPDVLVNCPSALSNETGMIV